MLKNENLQMFHNTHPESDLEGETNFQYSLKRENMLKKNNLVFRKSDKNQQKYLSEDKIQRRRASECSYYIVGDGSNNNYYGLPLESKHLKRLSNGFRRSQSNKSSLSTSTDGVSTGSRSSSCSGTTSTSSRQPILPYPGFVEFSFKYLGQNVRPRNWCLQLITNPVISFILLCTKLSYKFS